MATQHRTDRLAKGMPVLLTRPAAQCTRFGALLQTRFPGRLRLVTSPLIAPTWVYNAVPARPWRAILLTSETGAEAAGLRRLRDRLPPVAVCVGHRTAEVATAAGFQALVAGGDAASLVGLVQERGMPGPLLHLCGRDTRGDIAATLTAAGIETTAVTVYDQQPQPLNAAGLALLCDMGPVILPIFSPRTATLLVAEVQRATLRAPLLLAALSPAVAEALSPLPRRAMQVAIRPDAEAMAETIGRMLDAPAGDSRLP